MKFFSITKLCIPAGLLMLVSVSASADTCSSSGQSLDSLIAAGSCTIGDLTFSNFYYNYTAGTSTGSGTSAPSTPSATTDVTLLFNEINDGASADTYGTVGSPTQPVYQVITDYTNNTTVDEFQNEHAFVQFLVTDNTTGTVIVQVDDAIAGTITDPVLGATNALTDNSICVGGEFVQSGGLPSSTCSTGNRNDYEAVNETSGGLALTNNANDYNTDSSLNYSAANGGMFVGTYASGASMIGVYNQVDMNGGASDPSATSTLDALENDFVVDGSGSSPSTPEPGTIILLGGALIGFGALRRSKKTT